MKKKLDLNDVARFEKAIAKKYGPEAIAKEISRKRAAKRRKG